MTERYHFSMKDNELYCEDIPLSDLAERYGTPLYVYSKSAILDNAARFTEAFMDMNGLVCYSVKSNGNLAVLGTVAEAGCGADIVSGGELFRCLRAGIEPGKIVYSGVGKREDEIRAALEAGILMFNVESPSELDMIGRVSERLGKEAGISVRVNPDIDAGTHRFTTTATRKNKFGIPMEEALHIYRKAADMKLVTPMGVDVHLGSPVLGITPYERALDALASLVVSLRKEGMPIRYLDLGGGFGITYRDEKTFTIQELRDLVNPVAGDPGLTLIIEPGRSISGPAGVLVTRITYIKDNGDKIFYICDAGMNDLIRPPLYGAFHEIIPLIQRSSERVTVDVVGPVCESTDYLAQERELPTCLEGDLLAVMDAGAYSFSMSSNYNGRTRAAEVMVRGDSRALVRERESYGDLVKGEHEFR